MSGVGLFCPMAHGRRCITFWAGVLGSSVVFPGSPSRVHTVQYMSLSLSLSLFHVPSLPSCHVRHAVSPSRIDRSPVRNAAPTIGTCTLVINNIPPVTWTGRTLDQSCCCWYDEGGACSGKGIRMTAVCVVGSGEDGCIIGVSCFLFFFSPPSLGNSCAPCLEYWRVLTYM